MSTISGRAYGARATLEVSGEALTWRARRGDAKENIATTMHDVRAAHCTSTRLSLLGLALAAGGGAWVAVARDVPSLVALALGVAVMVARALVPRRVLRLELADRVLVLEPDDASLAAARRVVAHIGDARATSGAAPPIALP